MLAIVQARFSSSRLPGKVLRPLAGKPMLGYLLDGVAHAEGISSVVVATSDDPSDDAVEEFCRRRNQHCFRGSLDDVAGRIRQAVTEAGAPAFVRLNGDSPLLDPKIVDRAVALFGAGAFDLVSNVQIRTFPKGQSVEVLRSETFARSSLSFSSAEEREHVTPHFYANADRYRIVNFTSGHDYGGMHHVVDTLDDFNRVAAAVGAMDRPHWAYSAEEISALMVRGAEKTS